MSATELDKLRERPAHGESLGGYRAVLRSMERWYFRSPASRFFAWLMSRKARHLYEYAADQLGGLPDGSRLADIGCGHGTFLAIYLSRHPNVRGFGLDQSGELIKFATAQAREAGVDAEFLVGDVHFAKLPEKAFDAMVSTSSIYCWQDPVQALDNLYDALKPGATFLLWEVLRADTLRDWWSMLFDLKVYGLSLPSYTEAEMRDFVARSRFKTAQVDIDRLFIRFTFTRPVEDDPSVIATTVVVSEGTASAGSAV
ncbi:MAG: methyltransferase domain-containing protein [Deltaproteobacteria bacterium]|nr:methyltransferase domain-containing protein [Deltaproteobacteria bacterium]MCB9480132.1 methyltransferase domain-containing protein [Deltaproteobacteria bacterium]MCB9487997.1 methyltransferase domain-containing protein [Deltaproteobacteria bacterium]